MCLNEPEVGLLPSPEDDASALPTMLSVFRIAGYWPICTGFEECALESRDQILCACESAGAIDLCDTTKDTIRIENMARLKR